jgi:hypothetical protein
MTTLVTDAQVAQLRRMVAEPTTTTYSDATLITYIETYPHMDQFGEESLDAWGDANTDWTPTYDLHAAAADIWEEKAATVSHRVDFNADGGSYSVSQQYEQYMKQCRYHRARRMPSTAKMFRSPEEFTADENWIGNLPESD